MPRRKIRTRNTNELDVRVGLLALIFERTSCNRSSSRESEFNCPEPECELAALRGTADDVEGLFDHFRTHISSMLDTKGECDDEDHRVDTECKYEPVLVLFADSILSMPARAIHTYPELILTDIAILG